MAKIPSPCKMLRASLMLASAPEDRQTLALETGIREGKNSAADGQESEGNRTGKCLPPGRRISVFLPVALELRFAAWQQGAGSGLEGSVSVKQFIGGRTELPGRVV